MKRPRSNPGQLGQLGKTAKNSLQPPRFLHTTFSLSISRFEAGIRVLLGSTIMKLQRFVSVWVAAGALCVAGANHAQATIAYDFTGVVGNQASGNYSLGTLFTVGATPVIVNGLGAYDNGGNGLVQSISVAIYEVTLSGNDITSGGLVIAPQTITSTDLLVMDTRFKVLGGDPITRQLNTGTYLIVANHYGDGSINERNWNASAPPSGPTPTATGGGLITFGGNYYNPDPNSVWGPTLSGFIFDAANTATPGYSAGNFDFTPVPEASHFALAGMGLLGLVYTGRCFWLRRRTA